MLAPLKTAETSLLSVYFSVLTAAEEVRGRQPEPVRALSALFFRFLLCLSSSSSELCGLDPVGAQISRALVLTGSSSRLLTLKPLHTLLHVSGFDFMLLSLRFQSEQTWRLLLSSSCRLTPASFINLSSSP